MAELSGPHTQALEGLAKFNHEVHRVAVLMCEELSLDPGEIVSASRAQGLTPSELLMCHLPTSTLSKDNVTMIQWESYRHRAALAIAAFRAVNKYILTEA